DLAQRMKHSWGMSEAIGTLSYAKDEEQIFLGREISQHRDYSEETAKKIDEEINSLIKKAYKTAQKVLNENLDILHKLAELLLEKETVMGSELDSLIISMKPEFEQTVKSNDQETDSKN
nr:cell division protein FtsH [Desulfobacterales bacterium]